MASILKKDESIFIPMRDGLSISNSQLRPRIYKSPEAFKRSFSDCYLKTEGVELVEYAPARHGRWILHDDGDGTCDQCHFRQKHIWDVDHSQNFCGVCGAKMDKEEE